MTESKLGGIPSVSVGKLVDLLTEAFGIESPHESRYGDIYLL